MQAPGVGAQSSPSVTFTPNGSLLNGLWQWASGSFNVIGSSVVGAVSWTRSSDDAQLTLDTSANTSQLLNVTGTEGWSATGPAVFSLDPVPLPPVPAPLPLLGVGAAFATARRLRRRMAVSRPILPASEE